MPTMYVRVRVSVCFDEMANFGTKFKSKCHGVREGGKGRRECVNERTSKLAKRKKLLNENKTEIPLSF